VIFKKSYREQQSNSTTSNKQLLFYQLQSVNQQTLLHTYSIDKAYILYGKGIPMLKKPKWNKTIKIDKYSTNEKKQKKE